MEKNLKDYLHLYLGCECQTPNGVFKLNAVYEDSAPVFYDSMDDFGWDEIKPILRPLSDMTEEEKATLGYSCMAKDEIIWTPEKVRLALKWQLDIYSLIEAGLAIDKTQLNK